MSLGLGAFVAGLAMLGVIAGCAAVAAWAVLRTAAPGLRGPAGALAWALLAATALILEHLIPLALGILGRPAVLVTSALLPGAALALASRRAAPPSTDTSADASEPAEPLVVRAAALVAALLVAGAALAFLRRFGAQPLLAIDALTYQLPQVARWMQSGSMWQLDQFIPDYSNATYPHHGNLLLLAVVLPFDSALLARLLPVPFTVMACAAAYEGARELHAPRPWALLAAAMVAALPVVIRVSVDGAQTDTPFLAFVAAGGLFLLRHHRTGARVDLLLAGLGLGLALGTKWYALTTLPPLLGVWAAARLVARIPVRRVAADAGVLLGVMVAAGGIWLVRNWVEAGNPLFPQAILGFNAPRDVIREAAGYSLADYPFAGGVWRTHLLPQFDLFFAAPGYVLAVAPLVALAGAAAARGACRGAGSAAAVAAAGLGILAVYYVMPFSAFGGKDLPVLAFASMRYAVPGLLAGAVALAWLGGRLPRPLRAALAAVLLAVIVQGLRIQYRPTVSLAAAAAATLVVASGAWVALRAWRIRPALALAGGLAVVLLGAGIVRDRAHDRGYAGVDPVLAYVEQRAPAGRRIGIAGLWSIQGVSPVLPAFGPRLANDVDYAGRFEDGMLRQVKDPEAFAALLRERRYDLLIVGRGSEPAGPVPQEAWARRAGFAPVVSSPRLALLARR